MTRFSSSVALTAASAAALFVQLAGMMSAAEATAAKPAAGQVGFNERIQPILSENCYSCHGPDPGSRKAGLRLDREEHAFKPLEKGGPAIVRGKPDESPLIKRIESKDEKEMMPPPEAHKTLKPAEIALLRQWVAEGAVYEEHWAFIAPKRPAVPAVKGKIGATDNAVDRFILARLDKEKLAPSPEADRTTLIRRVTYDLTGLPPTPAEVEAFLTDKAPGAYERVVDRLLASPRYGEHRAHYWLDYVRYSDTHGIHFDNYRAIWPYRDYVIKAFNQNKPYDRFVREQLAGDLLPAKNFDELAATGFVRCNLTTNEGGTIPEETYVNQVRDRVEAFGVSFLGLTTGCAACHDHKFDPFSQRDFYGLAAYLGNTVEKPWDLNIAEPPPVLRIPKEENRPAAEVVLARRAEVQAKLDARRARLTELVTAWMDSGKRPKPVAPDALELRLKLDEGSGDVVKNSAPNAKIKEFKADTNPLVWGESSWFWPSMRMEIFSRLNLGDLADVDAGDKFSGGGWLMLRAKPGGGVKAGTGSGTLLSRMGDAKRKGGAGWEIYQEATQFTINLVAAVDEPAPVAGEKSIDSEVAALAAAASDAKPAAPAPSTKKMAAAAKAAAATKRFVSVTTKATYTRDEWLHVFFTYDGSRKAAGVKVYVNGKLAEVDVKSDTLAAKDTIRTDAPLHLGRREDFNPMRETRYQDIRFYRRALAADEVARLQYEDVAAEIVARQPDPKKWTTDETFVAGERYFLGEVDTEARELAASVAAHDAAVEALTKDGTPSLIALEKTTPAYSDILKRGDYYARTERVPPTTPHFLKGIPAGTIPNRLALADWLLSPDQPLLNRVTVNRMWQEVFGRGLVESAGDFGIMGDRPSHPELLDWLAVELRENGWDMKKLYRLLVTSSTYKQAATVTPDRLAKDLSNRLLARGPRFRMDGEMLRDSALATSGLLVEKLGGPSVKPYQPPGLWEEVAMPESNTRVYVADKGEGLYRRSVYTFWKRASMPPSMETFDATSREVVCTRRTRSNTPLQAFVTMNDPQWFEAARKLAERAIHAAPAAEGRLDFLARTTLARPLVERERSVLAKNVEKFRARFSSDAEAAKSLLTVGASPVDSTLNPSELAQWTMVASQFLNLDEFLTK
jgi:mono/diheme cytochrome c family protein